MLTLFSVPRTCEFGDQNASALRPNKFSNPEATVRVGTDPITAPVRETRVPMHPSQSVFIALTLRG